jgi:predicted nucleic acid-binding protein
VATHPRYYLDTNIVISVVEAAGRLGETQIQFVSGVDGAAIEALTSELTLAECLVKPFADRNVTVVEAYLLFLNGRRNFPVLPIDRHILTVAARLRTELGVKLPDAIHIATAQSAACTVFLTNDRGIRLPEGMKLNFWNEI